MVYLYVWCSPHISHLDIGCLLRGCPDESQETGVYQPLQQPTRVWTTCPVAWKSIVKVLMQLCSLSFDYHCAQIIYINDDKPSLPVSMHTDHIYIQCFIAKYFVHICTSEERHHKWSNSSSGSNRLVRLQSCKTVMGWCTAQWKMLLFLKPSWKSHAILN